MLLKTSNINKIFLILTQIPFACSLSASNDTDSNTDNNNNAPDLIYTVLLVSLVIIICNFIGCAYIILRTYLRWRKPRSVIPMSLRFPYYIALTDILISLVSLINHGYGAAYREPLESPACEVISPLLVFSAGLTVYLIAAISVTTWLRVAREVYIDFGKYDYKLWVPVFSMAIVNMSFSVHGTTKQKYWCAPDETDYSSNINNDSGGTTISKNLLKDQLERKVYKKVITYILAFILQYTPALIDKIADLLNHEYEILSIITQLALNLGAFGNFFQYITNEGLSLTNHSNISRYVAKWRPVPISESKNVTSGRIFIKYSKIATFRGTYSSKKLQAYGVQNFMAPKIVANKANFGSQTIYDTNYELNIIENE
ncbi:13361_t:CDS:2 [Entrophospora sp. SA101]|nr:13361_t:CDS:2 [Entrophospora sp. SA101]